MRAKYIFQGIAVSVLGAFFWVFFYLQWLYEGRDKILVVFICAIFGLLMASIYLVPLGVAMGVVLPSIAFRKPLGVCLLTGIITGIAIAGLSSLLVTVVFELSLRAAFLSMCPVCSFFIVGWMLLLRRNIIPQSERV
ncbi:MAG: hypothetical protein ACXW3Z_03345 [Limisphaerales bacterium]